jgi:hypothetical protein
MGMLGFPVDRVGVSCMGFHNACIMHAFLCVLKITSEMEIKLLHIRFFISFKFNLAYIIIITIIHIHPVVQQYEPRSGLAHRQSGMVAVCCTDAMINVGLGEA